LTELVSPNSLESGLLLESWSVRSVVAAAAVVCSLLPHCQCLWKPKESDQLRGKVERIVDERKKMEELIPQKIGLLLRDYSFDFSQAEILCSPVPSKSKPTKEAWQLRLSLEHLQENLT
jgi:hypothetical protein